MSRLVLAALFVMAFTVALILKPTADPASSLDERFLTDRSSEVTLPLPDEDDRAFTFAVFGDRTGGPPEGIAVLAEAVGEANLLAPDLVMTVGDLVSGYNTTPAWLLQMQQYKGVMGNLDMPWFPVAGNHDVYWRGEGRPELEHEENYERFFGPLWYAFRHKGCWFVVLFTDETNPETGRKSFGDPAHQRISAEQLAWLRQTLGATADARHVFVFLHHPRWIGGNYGDDWDRVHELLVQAGNVTAVFAGHIHHMRYDPRDGIDYYSLATVGGSQAGDLPEAGYLHNYQLVTVRDDGIATTTYPVGVSQDPRLITGEVSDQARRATRQVLAYSEGLVRLDAGLGGSGEVTVTLNNPLDHPLELWLAPQPGSDTRWILTPGHAHTVLESGASEQVSFQLARPSGLVDAAFRLPILTCSADLLTPDLRVPLPDRLVGLRVTPGEVAPIGDGASRALFLDGEDDYLLLDDSLVALPQGPFTLEAWIRVANLEGNHGVLCKTESSGYGLFLNEGKPAFTVHLGGAYVTATAEGPALTTETWHHVAGVYDGAAVHLYVDGILLTSTPGTGERATNALPLIVGGDVDGNGRGTQLLAGLLDEVRISSAARYAGASFLRPGRHTADDQTALLLHMETAIGPWIRDASPAQAHPLGVGWPGLIVAPE